LSLFVKSPARFNAQPANDTLDPVSPPFIPGSTFHNFQGFDEAQRNRASVPPVISQSDP
jgi:hypothetical protein